MRVLRTGLYHVKVYAIALAHPKTIGHVLVAFVRGFLAVTFGLVAYIRATDKANLYAANPAQHHAETKYRRRVVASGVVADVAVTIASGVLWGTWGWVTAAGLHVVTLIGIGRRDRLVQPVYVKGVGREGMIIRIVDEITLTAALRKADAHTTIVSPPARLAHTSGYEVTVRVHPEGDPEKLLNGARSIEHKARKGERQVYVYRVSGSDVIRIVVLDADPWLRPTTTPSFVTRPRELNLWKDDVDLATGPDGVRWLRRMVEAGDGGGMIGGGAPRQGKTTFLRALVSAILLDPFANLRMIDGKAIDFEPVRPLAASFVGEPNMDDRKLLAAVTKLLDQMVTELKRRRELLVQLDVDNLDEKLAREHGMPTEWIVIDELAALTEDLLSIDKAAVARLIELLSFLVRMGPAVGIFVIMATQRPSEKSMPPALKGMVLFRFAFRVGDQAASMAIMSRAGAQWRADLLPEGKAYKGLALVRDVGPVRMDYVSRDDLKRVAAYAAKIRQRFSGGGMVTPDDPGLDGPPDVPPLLAAALAAAGDEDRVPTDRILGALGPGHTAESLAAGLRPYGVAPTHFRKRGGGFARGYLRKDLEQALNDVT